LGESFSDGRRGEFNAEAQRRRGAKKRGEREGNFKKRSEENLNLRFSFSVFLRLCVSASLR
jgi:hypothetical protein